ncbi:DUF1800 domain-containing protein [Marinicella sediminis]|uniref:DUF1800 domain-containing protein n=1 Tax=Marinicella sediminis TaxID=1792834 RepID=A0ABV7JB10_9GAMM|nr:DUF1800 domain-containing protein [Marinicella sediminis]
MMNLTFNNKTINDETIRQAASQLQAAGLTQPPTARAATTQKSQSQSNHEQLINLLNRITYGFSESELALAEQLGFDGYLNYQLSPETMNTSNVEALLHQVFPSLSMSYEEIIDRSRTDNDFIPSFELIAATLIRAAYQPSQLYEIMVEFWSNHFNVNLFDGPIQVLKVIDDRDNIRPHALGKFRDLLHANAKSPAMLIYLDGYTNTADGPNENYARELMELHTLGVNGGFNEDDVKEVARCFTGWTLFEQADDLFYFYAPNHDTGTKTVLGQGIPAGGGIEDGETVLDILAAHPSTAHFIATKLCRRFISDAPPKEAIDAVSETFQQTDGDIRAMLITLFSTDAFGQSTQAKFKRPVEYVLSLFRSLPQTTTGRPFEFLYRQVNNLGQLPFSYPAPTGFSDVSSAWLNTNALLDRWNLGFALAYGDLNPGRNVDDNNPQQAVAGDFLAIQMTAVIGDARTPAAITDLIIHRLLHRKLSSKDRDALIELAGGEFASTQPLPLDLAVDAARTVLAALLASRHFQQR